MRGIFEAVAAGTGQFAMALASLVQHVTAVESNAAMLDYLRHDASEEGLTTISFVPSTWQDAPGDLRADIVICSQVLYAIKDIAPNLSETARVNAPCLLHLYARYPLDTVTAPLWRHLHVDERQYPPGSIHALDVLFEMGVYANVEITVSPPSRQFHYASFDEAVDRLLEATDLVA